jgi:hypothetical protein
VILDAGLNFKADSLATYQQKTFGLVSRAKYIDAAYFFFFLRELLLF